MHKGLSVAVWTLFITVSLFLSLQGKPPANSQEVPRSQPTVAMTMSEYNQQRIGTQGEQLRSLQEFKTNQENYNRDVTGRELTNIHAEIAGIRADQSALIGEERGAFALLGLLGGLAVFFQVKRNKDKS